MSLIALIEAASFAAPFLFLIAIAGTGVVLHGAFPPPSEEVADAVLAACCAA
ncbi:hypothetical protein [Roseococcus pinisoli]|uniref:DedA family protein n=1 Tax=Roseococcus pinisoli TaxID=2835040 RepID=A0ABS5QKW4_9PROT|nr:hypothetical protein [Roseococcus pinisoli]MBS7813303.1 hypothetical protein [Roseococcus pinisoli]